MPYRKRGLFRRSRRGGGGGSSVDSNRHGRSRGGRHNRHGGEANPYKMLMYFVVIVFNLWYRRNKRLESDLGHSPLMMKDGENPTAPINKINARLEEDSEEKNEL